MGTVALQQQEKTISELEKEVYQLEKTEGVRKTEICDPKDRESRQQNEIETFREKLNEAHALIASNQQVIEYLNKQLTERDLKTFAPLSTVNLPLSRDTRSTSGAIHVATSSGASTAANCRSNRYQSASSPSRTVAAMQQTPGGVSTAAPGSVGLSSTGASEAEARQKRIEALLQSRGVPLVGPVKYKSGAEK